MVSYSLCSSKFKELTRKASESVQNAESAVGELKTILLRVLKNQEMLAERVYTIEGSASLSELTRGDKESISIHSQRMNQVAIGAVRPDIRDETTVNGPIRYTFEEDLQHSWVYQRSVIRGSVAFSIGASTQGTQSWSVLSGLSLSAVSNIAVYALPVYESDLKNSDLYYFGVADKDTAIKQDGSPAPLRICKQSRENDTSNNLSQLLIAPTPPIASLGRQIRLPVSKSFSLPFNNFNITTKSPGLNRTDGNRPVISEPALVHTTLTSFTDIRVTTKTLKSNCNHGERPVISEPPLIRPILPSFKDINVVDLTTRAPTPDSAGWQNVRLRPGFKGTIVRAPSFSGYEADVEDNWHETHEVQEFRRKRVKNWVEQRTHSLKV
jgi:hypothetical protein